MAAEDGHIEVRNVIERCMKQAIRADEALDGLEERIVPILASAPETTQGSVPREDAECELASVLSHLRGRVQDLASRVESISNRVRV
jgi:hypothetical protein